MNHKVDMGFAARLVDFDKNAVDAILAVRGLVPAEADDVGAERIRTWTFETVRRIVLTASARTVADAYNSRGVHLLALLAYAEPLEDEREGVLRAKPALTDLHMTGSLSLAGEGRHVRAAIGDFSEAIRLSPGHPIVHYNRGVAHQALGEHEPAIADLTEAMRLDRDDAAARANRGVSFYLQGQRDLAVREFDAAIRLRATAQTHRYRGQALAELDEHARAVDDFAESIRLDPENAAVRLARGNAYFRLGEYR